MSHRELEYEDFQLALKLLHSPAPNAKEEILKLVEKYSIPLTKQSSISSLADSPIKSVTGKRTAIISDDSETDVEDDDNGGTNETNGNACYVCKNSEINFNNDSLMKCHDCTTHCHRECHKPSISKSEYEDPRFIWYCSKCNKTVKKGTTTTSKPATVKSSLTKTSVSSTLSSSAGIKRKPETVNRKPGSAFNPSSSAIPLGKTNPTNLSMSVVQQRIANRKTKK